MNWKLWIVFVFVGILSIVTLSSALLPNPDQGNASNAAIDGGIRFIDLDEVTKSYGKAKKDIDALPQAFAAQIETLKARSSEVRKKKIALDPMNRNSPEYAQLALEVEVEELKLQRDGESLNREQKRKRVQIFISAYEDIRAALKKYAEANHLKAVLLVQREGKNNEEDSLEEKFALANSRQVLYYEPSLDVTSQIIKILNSQ